MEAVVRVYKIVNLLLLSFSRCCCYCKCGSGGSAGGGSRLTYIIRCCDYCNGSGGKLIFLLLILVVVNSPVSSANVGKFNYSNNSSVDNAGIPCLAGYSVFLQGNCVSCAIPLLTTDLDNDDENGWRRIDLTTKELLRLDDELSLSSVYANAQVFMCSNVSREDLEMTKINEGKYFLTGRLLRVVTIDRHPFVKVINAGNIKGVVFEVLDALSKKYNFTTKIRLQNDGKWGSEEADGTWNGMVGQVWKNQSDIGAAPFSVTLERAKAIEFSMSFHQEPTGILIPAPEAGDKLTILVRPLSGEVWLAIFTTVCVLVPSLFVMHKVSLRIRQMRDDKSAKSHASHYKPVNATRFIIDIIQFIIGSLVQEGLVSPVNKTTRFVIIIWWFLTLVLANVYVGYMISFLSAPKLFDLVDNLEGLLHQHKLKWTYRKNTALEDLFKTSVSGVYKAIGLGAGETDLASTDMAGVEKVLSGHFAFLKEKSFLDVALEKDFDDTHQCRMTTASETFFTAGFAFIVQKGCDFLELLDKEILVVVTTGLMDKWKRLHWPRRLFCVNAAQYIVSTQAKVRKLNLDDCQGTYFLLVCGLSLASFAFVMEITIKYQVGWKILLRLRSCVAALVAMASTNAHAHDDDNVELKGYKIIVIPIKEDIYRKLNTFKATR